MAVVDSIDLEKYCLETAERARAAGAALASTSGAVKNAWLARGAALLRDNQSALSEANAKDLAAAPDFGLTDAQIDRLRLTSNVVESMAVGLDEIATLAEPIGEVIESTVRPNGLEVLKVRVPLGVVFFIYESRPNVTADAAAISVKSGNAVILRGGKEAIHSNQAIASLLDQAGTDVGLPAGAVQLVSTTDRDAVGHFLSMSQFVDVAIPRGGEGLIRRVAAEAKMPVIKHFAGNCHVYLDRAADPEMAEAITINSKCQRLGVCNTAESIVVHEAIAKTILPRVAGSLVKLGIEVRGDARTCQLVPDAKPATVEDYAAEYLASIVSIRVVESLEDAIDHINRYGSHHTDAIVTTDLKAARTFATAVDSSAVLVNASTRFNDGGQFGLGAEIGISTDKFHARGPCGIKELTSYKYVVYGSGQTRE